MMQAADTPVPLQRGISKSRSGVSAPGLFAFTRLMISRLHDYVSHYLLGFRQNPAENGSHSFSNVCKTSHLLAFVARGRPTPSCRGASDSGTICVARAPQAVQARYRTRSEPSGRVPTMRTRPPHRFGHWSPVWIIPFHPPPAEITSWPQTQCPRGSTELPPQQAMTQIPRSSSTLRLDLHVRQPLASRPATASVLRPSIRWNSRILSALLFRLALHQGF